MNPITVCPTADGLSRLINGQLPESEIESLLNHLQECPQCVQKVGTLSDPSVTSDLHAAGTMPEMGKGRTSSR